MLFSPGAVICQECTKCHEKFIMLSIGLMSGTSMDGIDAALLETDGEFSVATLGHYSLSYHPVFSLLLKITEWVIHRYSGSVSDAAQAFPQVISQYLKEVLQLSASEILDRQYQLESYFQIPIYKFTMNLVIEHSTELHAVVVNRLIEHKALNPTDIAVVGYHGQTVFHRPSKKITIQLGDGKKLANLLKIQVVNDFRQQDIALGGQGAPFAPLYHQALAVRDQKVPLAVVNCGGIANITLIIGRGIAEVIGFDTGPGNGLIDRFVQQKTQGQEFFDKDGRYGLQGSVDDEMLALLYQKAVVTNDHHYFLQQPPKSLDINQLQLVPELMTMSVNDACATLEAFTADTIVNSLNLVVVKPMHWILVGGGWKNPVILKEFKNRLRSKLGDVLVMTAEDVGWHSQSVEAELFAYFAVRHLKGLPLSTPHITGVARAVSGGQLHLPD